MKQGTSKQQGCSGGNYVCRSVALATGVEEMTKTIERRKQHSRYNCSCVFVTVGIVVVGIVSFVRWMHRDKSYVIESLKQDTSNCYALLGDDSWVIGEPDAAGLTNQLFSVFAYVPMCRVLGATGLIVAPLYSRLSFSQTYGEINRDEQVVKLPFGEFFDFVHFQQYWSTRGLKVLEYRSVQHCIEQANHTDSNYTLAIYNRRQKNGDWWFKTNDSQIEQLAEQSNIKIPLHPRTIVKGEHKNTFMGQYNYFVGGDTRVSPKGRKNPRLKLLMDVYLSLKPASHIAEIVNHILAQLGYTFVGVHMRVERDIQSKLTKKIMHGTTQAMMQDPCFFGLNNASDFPRPLYLASGIFSFKFASGGFFSPVSIVPTTITSSGKRNIQFDSEDMSSRAASVMQSLYDVGFDMNNVHTMDRIMAKHNILRRNRVYHPEHFALVDLLVLSRSSCFVPTFQSSSLSYVIQRFRAFEEAVFDRPISTHLHLFSNYGW